MRDAIEVHQWEGDSFRPLVFTPGWQVAILNWEDQFARSDLREIERHNQTDEVFVLIRGQAAIFTCTDAGLITVTPMQAGVIYNVPAGLWHNLLATPDVSFIIVESRDTHLHDTEIRPLAPAEIAQIDAQLPEWAK